tara:strand:+ start:329 stop:439 length:111 start_codon:yes stop_codon:yes gene_type:complete
LIFKSEREERMPKGIGYGKMGGKKKAKPKKKRKPKK